MAMIRRFVNVVAEKYKSGVYSLHRLDVSKHLFYPSTPQEQVNTGGGDDPPVIERLKELPAPCVRIQPEPLTKTPVTRSMTDLFSLISPRKNEGRIIFVNKIGQTLLIDADSNTTRRMPTLKDDKGVMPILISLAPPDAQDQREEDPSLAPPDGQDQREDLYFMTRRAAGHLPGFRSCFDVLKLGVSGGSGQWLGLPPPPFVDDPQYDDKYTPAIIRSHAVVDGGRTICVSFHKGVVGTYCFDTALRAWRHVGDWSLPFDDCAEYVPHLNLWLCFSRETPQDLCWTSELSGMPMEQPPELQHFRDSVTPENWSPMMSTLVNLGSGRFCITKFFEIKRSTSDEGYNGYFYPVVNTEVAVMTGIEICGGKEGPKVRKHKSIMYQFMDDAIRWVL